MKEPQADDFEVTVTDTHDPAAEPGSYVTADGGVYQLAAPGQRAMLQAVEHLPPDATQSRVDDPRLRSLADVADDLASHPAPPAPSRPADHP